MTDPPSLSHAEMKRLERTAETERGMLGMPPSAGAAGLLELVRRWQGLPDDRRRELLLLAREMSQGER
jgi:uncharacterized protein HemY